jgi:hypothetical protein
MQEEWLRWISSSESALAGGSEPPVPGARAARVLQARVAVRELIMYKFAVVDAHTVWRDTETNGRKQLDHSNKYIRIKQRWCLNTSYREKTRSILGVGVDSWQGVIHGP